MGWRGSPQLLMQPESRLVKNLKAYATSRGARAIKIHGGDNPYQEVGIADLLLCYKGRFIAWEVKMPGQEGSVSKKQSLFLRSIESSGGIAEVITSVEEAEASLAIVNRMEKL